MMRRLMLFFLSISVLLFTSGNVVLGDELKLETEVNHVANVFEKFKEKVTLFFKFSKEDKFNYQKFLLDKRLAELVYVIGSDNWDPIEETSSRYATYLGNFSQYVIKGGFKDKKGEVLGMYEGHSKILEDLQKNFKFESGWWLLLQHDINSVKIFSTQIKDSL